MSVRLTNADRIAIAFLAAIGIFFASTVRLRERLTCQAVHPAGLDCERVQVRLFRNSRERFHIADQSTVALRLSGHTDAAHASINTSGIDARDFSGRTVRLLSVPDRNVAYANGLVLALRQARQRDESIVFQRDETRSAWLFAVVIGCFTLLYAVGLIARNTLRR